LRELFPMVNLLGNQALGIGALSYAGRFGICLIGDRQAFPDIDVLAEAMRDELRALEAGIGFDRPRPGALAATA
jgi:diacylglycerol O-acyltransferase / wax synthase